jgi:hypothetical protein
MSFIANKFASTKPIKIWFRFHHHQKIAQQIVDHREVHYDHHIFLIVQNQVFQVNHQIVKDLVHDHIHHNDLHQQWNHQFKKNEKLNVTYKRYQLLQEMG